MDATAVHMPLAASFQRRRSGQAYRQELRGKVWASILKRLEDQWDKVRPNLRLSH